MKKALVAATIAALLAACGGHSGVMPSRTSSEGATHATLVLKIPKHAAASAQTRRPAYISASTQSVTFSYSIDGTPYPAQTFDVTPAAPNCSVDGDGNTVCTASFGAQPGNATYTIVTYDEQNAGGNVLARAQASMTIVAGTDNQFDVTLDGAPKTFKLSLAQSTVTEGTAADIGLTVAAYDSDGNLIVDSPEYWASGAGSTYDTATVTTSDPSEFSVQQNGTTLPTVAGDPSTYQLAMPFTNLTAHYSGTGMSVGTLTLDTPGTGLSDQETITVQAPPPTITEYAVPYGDGGPAPQPWGIAADASGHVWFTDNVVDTSEDTGRIGEVAADGTMTMQGISGYLDRGIALGPDGNFWMTGECSSNIIDVYTTGGVYVTGYALGSENSCWTGGGQIVSGTGGNLWFSLGNDDAIGQITTSGTATTYATNGLVGGITVGPDGNMWFAEVDAGKIGTITADGTIAEHALPSGIRPEWIATGSDGNLWFTEVDASGQPAVGKMTTDGTYAEYDMPYTQTDPYYYGPGGIVAGPDGKLWFGDEAMLASIDPASGAIATYSASGWGCGSNEIPRQFVVTDSTTMWFTDLDGCIGKIELH